MPLNLPRRHRRKRLFPPGLLALAGLLWLGCVALGEHPEQLRRRSVMQLTMPVRPKIGMPYSTISWIVPNPDTLLRRGLWRESILTGNDISDGLQQQQIIKQLRASITDTLHTGGLRVELGPTAQYASMIFLLDLLLRENIKNYWFDFHQKTVHFYAYTNKGLPQNRDVVREFHCGTAYKFIFPASPPPLPLSTQIETWATNFWRFQWLEPLLRPEWRVTAWLLATIAALSGWRILRALRVA